MAAFGTPSSSTRGLAAAIPVHLGVAAFVASAAVGVWTAPERASAVANLQVLAIGGLAYAIAWALGRRPGRHRVVPIAAALAGALCAAYFLTQYRHLDPDAKVSVPHALGQLTSALSPPLGWWRPQTNTVGTWLEGLLCLAAGLALAHGSLAVRACGGGAAAVMALGLVVSASRGSWLAAAVAIGAAAVVAYPMRKPSPGLVFPAVLGVVLAVIAATAATGVPWWMRLATSADRPDRLEVYEQAITLIRDTTFTGIGAGDQFAVVMSKYALLIQVPYLTYSHNLALDLWLEQGLPGLATWWALAAATVGAAVAGERAGLGWGFRGVWAGLLAIHVHGLSDARQSVDAWTWLPFFVLTGLLAAHVSRRHVRLPRARAWSWAPVVVAVLVASAAAVGRGSAVAAWHANQGALAQARADLRPASSAAERAADRAEARARFEQALADDPGDVPALRRLGLLDLAAEHHGDAVRHLRDAWLRDGANFTSRKAFGLASVWTGDVDMAAETLAGVPDMATELNTWSNYRASRGEFAMAMAAARTSLRLHAQQPATAEWLARLERDHPDTTDSTPVPKD